MSNHGRPRGMGGPVVVLCFIVFALGFSLGIAVAYQLWAVHK